MASECIVAGELGLPYAAICVVDNLANGIGSRPLSVAELEARSRRQRGAAPRSPRRDAAGARPLSADPARRPHRPRRPPRRRRAGRPALRGRAGSRRSGRRSSPSPATRRSTRRERRWSPPLVNGHTHAAMTLFRGYGGDLPLMRWLRGEDLAGRGEARARGRLLGRAARLRGDDPHRHRPLLGHVLAPDGDRAGGPRRRAARRRSAGRCSTLGGDTEEAQATALRNLEAHGRSSSRRSAGALAPHAIYTASEKLLRWTAELAAEHGVPIHIHLSETEQEVGRLRRRARSPARPPTSTGSACSASAPCSPTASGSTAAELELIAERGATVVTNPVANMKLAVGGVFPYPAAREAGVAVGLGTDGAGSNDSLDLLADLKAFALAQRHAAGDPTAVGAAEAWGIATGAPRPAARRGTRSCAAGAPADFLLLRRDAHELGLGDLASDLVYAASGSVVETTVVGGAGADARRRGRGRRRGVARAAERAARLGIGLTGFPILSAWPILSHDRRGPRTVAADGLRGLVGAGARLRDLGRRPGLGAARADRGDAGRRRRPAGRLGDRASAPPPPPAPTRRSRSPRASSRRAPRPPRRSPSSSPRPTWSGSWGWSSGSCSAGSSPSPSTSAGS